MMCLCLRVKGILHYVQNDRVDNPSGREGMETLPYNTREAWGGEGGTYEAREETDCETKEADDPVAS